MGIAKSIEAYSVYELYNSNTDIFIKNLSDKLNSDFIINMFDKEFERIGNENEYIIFNKEHEFKLTITYDKYKIDEFIKELPTYEISIPIKFIYEDSIELTFYPNQAVFIRLLTFEHLWSTFIETLKFQSVHEDRQQAINRYEVLRNEYSNILQQIGISQIFIVTHAYYEIERVMDIETFNKLTFEKIIEVAQVKDKLTIFDFQNILNATDTSQLDKIFISKPNLEIILLDTLRIR